ncbi:hypothetical protein RUM43_012867 [Polyplax serrata]|uniref:Uncharacterized protein n=1 Tax=Polyplax serrata TaxID=468196 RepID=A0AAN8PJN2_POLSC
MEIEIEDQVKALERREKREKVFETWCTLTIRQAEAATTVTGQLTAGEFIRIPSEAFGGIGNPRQEEFAGKFDRDDIKMSLADVGGGEATKELGQPRCGRGQSSGLKEADG